MILKKNYILLLLFNNIIYCLFFPFLTAQISLPVNVNVSSVATQPETNSVTSTQVMNVQVPQQIISSNALNIVQEDEANIYLNFDGVSLASIVNYLGEQKKINLIPHKDLENSKVSISTRSALTFERAWDVLLTLLEMNGFSMIKIGNVFRIVLSKDNGQEPLPMYSSGTGTDPDALPNSDMVIRYVYFFKNIKVETAKTILSKMIDEKNIADNHDLNVCIIKDQSINIKSAMKIIKALDAGGLSENIQIIPLTWASSENVQKLFSDILGTDKEERIIRFTSLQKEGVQYFSTATRIYSEPVKNSLILLGTEKNINKIKEFIYKYLDVPIDDAESRLHIKELRYIRAQDIKPILDDMIKTPKTATTDKGLIIEGGYKVFEDVIIAAENDDDSESSKRGGGNRLIIACNRGDWKRLEEFIEKIDKPQPQVAVEIMIIDVGIGQVKALGAQMFNFRGKPIAHNINAATSNLSSASDSRSNNQSAATAFEQAFFNDSYLKLANSEGSENQSFITLGRSGKDDNIWALIKSVITVTNAQVISQPYVIVNNHQPCEVTVKATQRVAGGLELNKSLTPVVKKESLDAKIGIKLTPHINLVGIVDLEIGVTIDEFKSVQSGVQPTITQRQLTTKASMATGEVLTLGGLTKSDLKESVYKTPILGDIPFIGSLFKNKRKDKTEQNLYIFIRPSIIKPRFEGAPDEYTQLKLDYAKLQIMKNDLYVHDRDPIQRWFFKPAHQSVKEKLSDASRGILRPVDDFIYGQHRPKSVNLQEDPFFTISESREKVKKLQESSKMKALVKKSVFSEPMQQIAG